MKHNKIIFSLEFGSYPIKTMTDGVAECDKKLFGEDAEIISEIKKLQERYDLLFNCDRYAFSYIGFNNAFEKLEFFNDIDSLLLKIEQKYNVKIENQVDFETI